MVKPAYVVRELCRWCGSLMYLTTQSRELETTWTIFTPPFPHVLISFYFTSQTSPESSSFLAPYPHHA